VEGEHAYVNDLVFTAPGGGARSSAHVFVRPHELEIHRAAVAGSFAARVDRVVPLGAATRVELTAPGHGRAVEVELDLRRSEALALAPGDAVHLAPRRVRVFPASAAEEDALDSLTASGL
jgi:sulfate transport system ATP-binding protein